MTEHYRIDLGRGNDVEIVTWANIHKNPERPIVISVQTGRCAIYCNASPGEIRRLAAYLNQAAADAEPDTRANDHTIRETADTAREQGLP